MPLIPRIVRMALGCAFAVLAQGCTLLVWRDDRGNVPTWIAAPDAVRAFRVQSSPSTIAVQLTEADARRLRNLAPELPADFRWVVATARDPAFAHKLDALATADPRWPMRLVLFRDPEADHAIWALDPPWWPEKMIPTNWSARYRDAAADALLATAPPALGAELFAVAVEHATLRDDGTPILGRIAMTPLALVFDTTLVGCVIVAGSAMIVLSPFAHLIHELFGREAKPERVQTTLPSRSAPHDDPLGQEGPELGPQVHPRRTRERRTRRRSLHRREDSKGAGIAPAPDRPTSWRTFLNAHPGAIAAAGSFAVEAWTARGLVTHYMLFAIDLTKNPKRVRRGRQPVGSAPGVDCYAASSSRLSIATANSMRSPGR